jgi:hypothetical protein
MPIIIHSACDVVMLGNDEKGRFLIHIPRKSIVAETFFSLSLYYSLLFCQRT